MRLPWDRKELLTEEKIHFASFAAKITKDMRYIITVGSFNQVKIYLFKTFKEISTFQIEHNQPGTTLSIHPNNELFAIGSADGQVFVYDLQEVLDASTIQDWHQYE